MSPELPPAFIAAMRDWLGPAEWADLEAALAEPGVRGLRLHRVGKAAAGQGADDSPLAVAAPPLPLPPDVVEQLGDPVPWAPDGRYIPADSDLGRHVYHDTGAYYIQEPSAMAAAVALGPRPGERVLDLCAAPGGKATALGAALRGRGQLVANEIHPARVRVLAQNLERLGVPALVTHETPARLAERWPGRFDAVLVDAPCSGEGMFRKDPEARREWTAGAPEACAARQREILVCAARLARPGGRIVYSTCTFNPVENERVVAWAVARLGLQVAPLQQWPGWTPGRPEWADGLADLEGTRRLWPHRAHGEGHFVALLAVSGQPAPGDLGTPRLGAPPPGWREWLGHLVEGEDLPKAWLRPLLQGDHLFADEARDLPLDGLRVLRPGLCLAESRGNGRYEPHHQLAMALAHGPARRHLELTLDDARSYLQGQALRPPTGGPRGLLRLHVHGLPLGWGRALDTRINNLYPKGLRRTLRRQC